MLIFKNEFKFILNFAEGPFKIRMDTTPLYYDLFPGSIIDQLHVFGYQNVGLLFDRGYFSEPNVRELDAHGFEFIMMLRDDQNFVKKLIKAHVSMLRDNPDAYVSGMEVFGLDVDKEKHMLKSYSVKDDKVNDRIACAGFFVIMTSESLEADVTLDIYRGRDNIEKFFRGIKSGMDFDSPGVYDNQSLAAKIHLMFIAGIIRNRFSIASAAIKN